MTKQEAWSALSLREKCHLIWGMRTYHEEYDSLWLRIKDHINPREWIWRYQAAKLTAHIEANLIE